MDFDQNLKEQVDIILKQKNKMGSKITLDINKNEESEISSSDDSKDDYMKNNFPSQYAKNKQ